MNFEIHKDRIQYQWPKDRKKKNRLKILVNEVAKKTERTSKKKQYKISCAFQISFIGYQEK
ncbi:hypothetical protein GCM10008106_01260 [Mongoliitalea lutea]|uniref:Uncharacterized protein n=1 Tax=Mongoliitalea lutea TaxID=849756 RepID=A0A8J3CTJ5_9BACT|nr:hypothetical protein GCM10008106_01260 [Mongoliitalea lutea]